MRATPATTATTVVKPTLSSRLTYAVYAGKVLITTAFCLLIWGCEVAITNNTSGEPAVSVRGVTEVREPSSGDVDPDAPQIQRRDISDVTIDLSIPDKPRQFRTGIVSIGAAGPDFTKDDLADAVKRAATAAECVVIRPLIDWEFFRPGGSNAPDRLYDIIEIVKLARQNGMPYSLIELDPFLTRHSVSPLPDSLAGQNFSSPDVRQALRGMVMAVVEQVRPTYLAFAVEVNGYYEADPEDFCEVRRVTQGALRRSKGRGSGNPDNCCL